jgi:hypothetical protein
VPSLRSHHFQRNGALTPTAVGGGLSIEFLRRAAIPPFIHFIAGALAHTADDAAWREAVLGNGVVEGWLATKELLRANQIRIVEDGVVRKEGAFSGS